MVNYFFCYSSTLRHPNIVVFMGYALKDEHVYLFTNYVHGGDLYKLLFKEVIVYVMCARGATIDGMTRSAKYPA